MSDLARQAALRGHPQRKSVTQFLLYVTCQFKLGIIVKFQNFRTPENFTVICLKFKQRGQTLGYFVKKNANGIANIEDPDQTAPLGAV